MTHDDLIERARRWLVGTKRCAVVLTEFAPGLASEIPDAIGWTSWGVSTLVECKTSRGDFLRDVRKPSRRNGRGVGVRRYYFCPPALIHIDEVPGGWGLVYVHPSRCIVKRKAVAADDVGHTAEKALLVKTIRHGLYDRRVTALPPTQPESP